MKLARDMLVTNEGPRLCLCVELGPDEGRRSKCLTMAIMKVC